MSLPDSNADFDVLAGKGPGQLITSADWNAQVAAAKSVQSALNELSRAVDARFTAVETNVRQVVSDLQNATARLAVLETAARAYNRVTLRPALPSYALGEVAIITATVADISGNPITFQAENRPWVTFVCTWGRLRAVQGFDSAVSLGDRTVTVRVNQSGVAQVRLVPDHVEGFDIAFEDDVAVTMTGKVAATNRSVADILRSSETPATARDADAFKFLSQEYDRPDSTHMRNYVDAYYQKYPGKVRGRPVDNFPGRWLDYRTTVFCFVQNSNDPSTPDFGRASGATQVVFRDWISPWYNLEYSVNTGDLIKSYRDRLTPKFTQNFTESVNNIKGEINTIVSNQGLLRKQRDYRVIRDALDQVNVPQPPSFLNAVTQSVQNAISIQQTLQTVQSGTVDVPAQEVAFEVFTNAATRADNSAASANDAIAEVKQQLSTVQQNVKDATDKVATLTGNLTAVGTRLDSALADSGAVGSMRLQLNTVKGQVAAFSALNPADITAKIGTVTDLSNRVFQLETRR
jgi:predicted  nucleic acid-binding Zn-ribbon protein